MTVRIAALAALMLTALPAAQESPLQLGMWTELSASSEQAWAASRARAGRGVAVADLDWQSLVRLQYSRLQEGRYREARALIDTARTILAPVPPTSVAASPDAGYVVETMEFQYGAETGDWTHVTGAVADVRRLAMEAAAASSPRAREHALAAAYHVVAALAGRRDATAGEGPAAIRSAFAGLAASDPRRAAAEQLALQTDALVAIARGDHASAIDGLTRLAGDPREPGAVPAAPPSTRPPAELLGAELAAAGRFKEAIDAYVGALVARPNRSAALLGLARARTAVGDRTAADTYAQLRSNWEHADATVPGLAEVRRRAAQ